MTKVQLSLTDQEALLLSHYGSQFGYNLPKTIRYLISKTTEQVMNEAVPTFLMSKKTEEDGLKALEEHRLGKTKQVNDVNEFISSL
jgi:hypothetical protein